MTRTQTHPLMSFVVVNWNGLADTKRCIESIKKVNYPNKELIIVDNGSTDGSKDYFRTLKDIRLVDLPTNTGFTGGHIAGREVAKGEYLAIINSDLLVDPNWANVCLETLKRHPDAALVGGKAFKWNDDNPAYNSGNEFYSFQEVDPDTAQTRTFLVGDEECSVDGISGAALLFRQSCLRSVGYLDDTFFLYYEETDLIARLMRAGFRAYYNPNAHTWHRVGGSSGAEAESETYLYHMHRNRYIKKKKNFDEPYLRHFLKHYRREVWAARLRHLRRPNDRNAACRMKAWRWIRAHQALIYEKRAEVQKMGGSYIDKLRENERGDVTVVITCYNYGAYVAEAIKSVLDQTVQPKQIIIIDDASTDDSTKVIYRFKKNPLITTVYKKKNAGVVDGKNLGIGMSKTYWTVFLDADDKLSSKFLERTIELSRHGAKDVVYTDMQLFGAVNDIFRAKPFSVHTLLKTNYINNSALIKTTLLKQVGGYKAEMHHGLEDWELYITLVEAGAKPQYLPLPLMQYRQHEGALGRNIGTLHREKELIGHIKRLHRGMYRKNGYYRTIMLHGLRMLAYCVRYPALVFVMLKAIPSGLKQAVSYVYGRGLAYVQAKVNQQ